MRKFKLLKNKTCVVCDKPAVMQIWCYSGNEYPYFCSIECFQKLCDVLKEPYMTIKYGPNWNKEV